MLACESLFVFHFLQRASLTSRFGKQGRGGGVWAGRASAGARDSVSPPPAWPACCSGLCCLSSSSGGQFPPEIPVWMMSSAVHSARTEIFIPDYFISCFDLNGFLPACFILYFCVLLGS